MSSTMSPRLQPPFQPNGPLAPPFMTGAYGPPGGSMAPGMAPPALAPLAMPPRSYPVPTGPSYDNAFRHPIGPPSKQNIPGSPIGTSFNPGPSTGPLRRASLAERPLAGNSFGVVQRPPPPAPIGPPSTIAPIARPHAKEDEKSTNSPSLRSPSSTPNPEPVLGSSALVADDDEPILPRRPPPGNVSQVWGHADPLAARSGWPASQGVPFGAPNRAPNGMWGASAAPEQWQAGFPPHSPFTNSFPNHSPPPGAS